jgi:putative ABC transport system permease protein
MLLYQNVQIALRALTANKMRSILTMLGIIIGVGAVVALLAIGSGATESITGQIEGIGSNLVSIMPGRMQTGMGAQSGVSSSLFYSDYEAINQRIGGVDGVAPTFQATYLVKNNSDSSRVSVSGVTEDYFPIHSSGVKYGRLIDADDARTQARVAVLGPDTAADLFGKLNPIGKTIKINGIRFEVVGVLESKGGSIQNSDDVVLIPLQTGYEKLFGAASVKDGKQLVSAISMSASTPDDVDTVMAQATYILRREHKLDAADDADFSVISQSDILSTLDTITTTLQVFLGAIAGISLLVGGIGIMNIMLVSVTERTKEIGLRKAVGARKEQILVQFMVETVMLSLMGGIIGIAFGLAIAGLITVANLITANITLGSILLAFGFALAVGLFFGIYPAYRAAKLHPIEALRYE